MPPTPEGIASVGRLPAILLHIPYFSIEGPARLADACHVAPSTISRILRGHIQPDKSLQKAIARALSARRGFPIPVWEIFPQVGSFITPSVCELMDCDGCLPPEAWNEITDMLRERWRGARPGYWSRHRATYPRPNKTGEVVPPPSKSFAPALFS